MREKIEAIRKKILDYWENTEKKKRIKYIVGIIGLLILLMLGIFLVTTPKYEVLYGNLSLEDIAEITNKLDEVNIAWKVGERDNSILVVKDKKTDAKLELAAAGLPKDGYSFMDAFSDSSWTMTDYDKKQRMKQALQSELARTISEIDGVKSAKVYIEEKEKTNFVLDNEEAENTASVFIVKNAKNSIGNEKVMAIKNLVAGSASIKPENVIITDDEGRLLDGINKDSATSETQFRIKQNLETRINDSIRNFLANIYGYDNVDVLSSVKINLDSEKRTEKIFSPPIEGSEEGIVRSTEEMQEDYTGGLAIGPPGERDNTQDYDLPENHGESSSRASKIINNEINEINREISKTPGQVESITVAVLINEKSLPEGELTLEKSEEISNLIYAATGLDTKSVKVIAEEFTQREMEETKPGLESIPKNYILIILGLLLLGFIIYKLLTRRKEEERARIHLESSLLNDDEVKTDKSIGEDFQELDFELEESNMKKQIDKFIDEKPYAVAQLLRNWLNE